MNQKPLKIVYIDDEIDLCEMFSDLFSSPETEIKTYIDPQVAINEISSNPPDLIFLDYRLPGITGDEVAKKLNNNIPKILITGDANIKTEYSFNKIYTKPYEFNDMREFLNQFYATLR